MSTAKRRILRVRRSDNTEDLPPYALVSVTPGKNAKGPLDLKLLATEGENAFVTTVKHDKITDYKSKSYTGTDSEWKSILSRTLLHTSLTESKLDAAALEGLEVVCSVPNNETLIITWQRRKRTSTVGSLRLVRTQVVDVTDLPQQILGSISLSQTEDESIDPFIWAGDAVEASDTIEDQLESLQQRLEEEEQTTAKLKTQLQSLVAAKEEHEQALFAKFVELLNAKKLKVRDQQRLLAGAKLDDDAGRAESQTATKKRPVSHESSSDDDSDAFEDVSVKAATVSPIQSDMDLDDERESTPPPSKAVVRRVIGGNKAKQQTIAKPKKNSTGEAGPSSSGAARKADSGGQSDDAAFDNPPPPPKRRELPFQRKADPLPPPPTSEPEQESEATPAVTRSQAKVDDGAMDEDSDTEEEL